MEQGSVGIGLGVQCIICYSGFHNAADRVRPCGFISYGTGPTAVGHDVHIGCLARMLAIPGGTRSCPECRRPLRAEAVEVATTMSRPRPAVDPNPPRSVAIDRNPPRPEPVAVQRNAPAVTLPESSRHVIDIPRDDLWVFAHKIQGIARTEARYSNEKASLLKGAYVNAMAVWMEAHPYRAPSLAAATLATVTEPSGGHYEYNPTERGRYDTIRGTHFTTDWFRWSMLVCQGERPDPMDNRQLNAAYEAIVPQLLAGNTQAYDQKRYDTRLAAWRCLFRDRASSKEQAARALVLRPRPSWFGVQEPQPNQEDDERCGVHLFSDADHYKYWKMVVRHLFKPI